jgi:mannose-6-phosphate isomerase-like protein (cupin superfamily)
LIDFEHKRASLPQQIHGSFPRMSSLCSPFLTSPGSWRNIEAASPVRATALRVNGLQFFLTVLAHRLRQTAQMAPTTYPTPESYANEPVRYPPLEVVDLAAEGAAVTESYRNMVITQVNDSCLRLAVFEEAYRWHYHPTSDELFIVIAGCLAIDLEDGREVRLGPWQCVTIPAGVHHRTRALGRTTNLCFEKLGAATVFVD